MKMWIARTLGGAVCTLSLIALGTGGAYASPHPADGGIDLDLGAVKVKVGGHQSSSDKGSSTSGSSSSSKSSSTSRSPLRVKVSTPGRVLPRVQVKAGVGSSSRGPSVKAGVRVGRSTQPPSSYSGSRAAAVKKAAQKKAEAREAAKKKQAAARRAAQKKAEAKRAAAKKAAAKKAAAVGATASLRALSKVVPPAVIRADAKVLAVPVRACVEVNASGCSRYVFSGTPTANPGSENGGGGFATVLPVARVVPSVVAKAGAKVPVVGQADACAVVNAVGCSTSNGSGSGSGTGAGEGSGAGSGSGSVLPTVVPPVLVRADASVLSVPVRACVEVNTTGCTRYVFSGAPATNPGSENGGGGYATVLPSAVAVAGADLPVVGQVDACVLINAAGCQQGTGTGTTGTGTGIIPPVVGTVGGEVPGVGTVGVCVLVNTPGCTTDGGGTNPGGDPTAPGTGDGNGNGNGDPGNGGGPGNGGPGDAGTGDGNGNGPVVTTDVDANAPVQADLGAQQGPGGDRSLAHTGAAAGTVGALGTGLALLVAGAAALRRRMRAGRD